MEEYGYISGLLQRDIAHRDESNIATNNSILWIFQSNLLWYKIAYTYLRFFETAIPTIPSHACAVSYGQYNDLKIAKFACSHDDKCTSIVDGKCDQVGPYHACGKQYPETAGISSTCNDSPIKEEGN